MLVAPLPVLRAAMPALAPMTFEPAPVTMSSSVPLMLKALMPLAEVLLTAPWTSMRCTPLPLFWEKMPASAAVTVEAAPIVTVESVP